MDSNSDRYSDIVFVAIVVSFSRPRRKLQASELFAIGADSKYDRYSDIVFAALQEPFGVPTGDEGVNGYDP